MIKDRLKELDIKITELAGYLNISRPTMYKFIQIYDENNDHKEIKKQVLRLFDYINSNPYIDKSNVINYILNRISKPADLEAEDNYALYRDVKKYILNNPSSEKTQFINLIIKDSSFDMVIHYLMEVNNLSNTTDISPDNSDFLKPYKEINDFYQKK